MITYSKYKNIMQEFKIIVSAILQNINGEVLLAQRPKSKKIAPGIFHLPGGHLEFGETPEEALIREMKEEFELEISVKEIIRSFSYLNENSHTVGITFLVEILKIPTEISFDKKDTESIVWVDEKTLSNFLKEDDHDFLTLKKFFSKTD
jgi:8-oxo-dGTP diphosphatase